MRSIQRIIVSSAVNKSGRVFSVNTIFCALREWDSRFSRAHAFMACNRCMHDQSEMVSGFVFTYAGFANDFAEVLHETLRKLLIKTEPSALPYIRNVSKYASSQFHCARVASV